MISPTRPGHIRDLSYSGFVPQMCIELHNSIMIASYAHPFIMSLEGARSQRSDGRQTDDF